MTHLPRRTGELRPRPAGRRRGLGAVVGAIALVTTAMAGCGVPVDEGARPVANENVPFGLLAPETGPPPTGAPPTTASPS